MFSIFFFSRCFIKFFFPYLLASKSCFKKQNFFSKPYFYIYFYFQFSVIIFCRMRPAYSIFACADHVPVSTFNWSMCSALVSRVDEGGTRNIDGDPICTTIEVLWDNCFGRATSTFLIVIRITGTMRSTSLNSDAVET